MNWSRVKVTTPPAAYPISVSEVKSHLRVDHDDEDAEIEQSLKAAIRRIDGPNGIGYALVTQTWTYVLDGFETPIELPGAPVASITSIAYIDTDGTTQTLDTADYRLVSEVIPSVIEPAYGTAWPATRAVAGAVTVVYTIGVAAEDVPADLTEAVAQIAAHFHENREAVAIGVSVKDMPMAAVSVLDGYRQRWIAG